MATHLPPDILVELERALMDRAGKRERNEIRFRCPNRDHRDEHPSARWNPDKQVWYCDACGAGGGAVDLCKLLGISIPPSGKGRGLKNPESSTATVQRPLGCTLEQYADAKSLPVSFLQAVGLRTISYQSAPSVRMPYRKPNGEEAAIRFRINLKGNDRFRWKVGSKPQLYGLERLEEARDRGYVILVEGESDCHTLWFHDEPAVGLPGASGWREERDAHLLDRIDCIFVVIEPDSGGEAVRKWLDRSSIRQRVSLIDLGEHKDPSGLYLDDPESFPARWRAAMNEATPLAEIVERNAVEAMDAAWLLAAPIAYEHSILDRVADEMASAGVAGERRIIKLLYLILTSRFLDRPVSAAIKGPSSGGKSYTLERVLELFPDNAFHSLSAMSEHALVYSEESLEHRFLVIYEASGLNGEFASYLIRSLLSEGRVRYETVEKTNEGMRPRLIERTGPTGLLITTTAVRLHPENETRLLSIPVTDTPAQTKAILRALSVDNHYQLDLPAWHAIQTWLVGAEHRVAIPYAGTLSDLVPPIAVRMRRDFGMILSLIRAHALLHQANRRRDSEDRILANLEDYASVRELVADLVAEGVEATVSATIRETVDTVRMLVEMPLPVTSEMSDSGYCPGSSVSLPVIANALKLDKSATARRVKAACDHGYLRNLQIKRGLPAMITLGEPLPDEIEVLPNVKVVAQHCGVALAEKGIPSPSPDLGQITE